MSFRFSSHVPAPTPASTPAHTPTPAPAPTPASTPAPTVIHPEPQTTYTVGDVVKGTSQHSFKTNLAKGVLLNMTVNLIKDVLSFLDGNYTTKQSTNTLTNLAEFAKKHGSDLAFLDAANSPDLVATYSGNVYVPKGDGSWARIHPPTTANDDSDETARVNKFGWSVPGLFAESVNELTETGNGTESALAPKKTGSVYGTSDPLKLRQTNSVSGKTSSTSYSVAGTKLPTSIGGGSVMAAIKH